MSQPAPLKLGTFLGVFTPTVLTILGVIMYLRVGWVVGNAGWGGTLLIVIIANVITGLTALSMSTLATSMRVGVGGAYFLISRSFGLEVGGAIGIPLYLSQVLSLTLYAYGLAEIPTLFFDIPGPVIQGMACAIIVLVTFLAGKSTEIALKAQIPIMGFIALSVVVMFAGAEWGAPKVPLMGPWADGTGFWQVFAVFFPAVTGVLTGLSLSGDLEDPSFSIPRGVFGAVAVGTVVYLIVPMALATSVSDVALRANNLVWTDIAVGGAIFILPGMVGAVLSSAFGAILSAPRTLQALASDGLAPGALAELDEDSGEPLAGLRLSGGIALAAAIFLPDLNAVASGVTVFFLTTYGALNAVAALEAVIGDPSFRPLIRAPWYLSLLGAIGCFGAMALISPISAVVAIGVEIGIGYWLSRRSLETTWGDARSGMLLTGARYALLRLREARFDPRNWRPHILVLSRDLTATIPALRCADLFGQHRGIVTLVHMIEGNLEGEVDIRQIVRADSELLERAGLDPFSEVSIVPDLVTGATTVAQANGFAGLHSNTVMFGLTEKDQAGELATLLRLARRMSTLEKSTLIFRDVGGGGMRPAHERTIVVWWAGKANNGDLMLLLAHLLSVSAEWRGARIILKSIADSDEQSRIRELEFEKLMPDLRMDLRVNVITKPEETPVGDLIKEHSRTADFVFLGLAIPEEGEERAYAERVAQLLEGMPTTVLVRNAGRFRGKLL